MLIRDLAHKNQDEELSVVVPFIYQLQFRVVPNFFTVTTSDQDLCMVEIRAQAMTNEKMETIEKSCQS